MSRLASESAPRFVAAARRSHAWLSNSLCSRLAQLRTAGSSNTQRDDYVSGPTPLESAWGRHDEWNRRHSKEAYAHFKFDVVRARIRSDATSIQSKRTPARDPPHEAFGGFHRAHAAVYIDDLMTQYGTRDWAICGVGLLQDDVRMRMRSSLRIASTLYGNGCTGKRNPA